MNAFATASLMLCGFQAVAQEIIHSSPAQGIYTEISLSGDGGVLESGHKLPYCFLTTNREGSMILYPKREYFCRLRLFDGGTNIVLTPEGSTWGSRFADMKSYSPNKIDWTGGHGSDRNRPKFAHLRYDAAAGAEIPAPEEIFEIPRPGRYEMRVEFQFFEQIQVGTNFSYSIVVLPPVSVPVVKK